MAGGDKRPLSEVQGQGRWHFFDRGARPLSGGEHLAYQSGLAGCVREGKKRLMANRLSVEWIEEAEHLAVGSTRRVLDRYRNRIEFYDATRSRMTRKAFLGCECRSLKRDNKKQQQNCVFLPVWYCYLKSTGNGRLDL